MRGNAGDGGGPTIGNMETIPAKRILNFGKLKYPRNTFYFLLPPKLFTNQHLFSLMSIIKYGNYQGKISELAGRFDAFGKMVGDTGNGAWSEWVNTKTQETSAEKLIIFVGKTGHGKSSTINAIAGSSLLECSDVGACTQKCECLCYHIHGNHWLSLGDLPGVGENVKMDEKYIAMYKDFIEQASVIVHVIRADTRDYSIDETLAKQLYRSSTIKRRVIYAIGQCDKIEPIERKFNINPTPRQALNIKNKISEVEKIFAPTNKIVPYSAHTGWNLDGLVSEIVRLAI